MSNDISECKKMKHKHTAFPTRTKKTCKTRLMQKKGLMYLLLNLVQKGVTKMKHSPDLTNEVRSFRDVGHF